MTMDGSDGNPVAAARKRVHYWRELLEIERRCDSAERSVLADARLALCRKDLPSMHRLVAFVMDSLVRRQAERDAARAACARNHTHRAPWQPPASAWLAQSGTRADWITDPAAHGEAVRLHFELVRQMEIESRFSAAIEADR